jgi:hypothetical protein
MSYSPSGVRRIQRNNIFLAAGAITNTYTLPVAVNIAKTVLHWKGLKHTGISSGGTESVFTTLTYDATTVTATRVASNCDVTVEFDLLEMV